VVAEENCELVYNEIFFANAKLLRQPMKDSFVFMKGMG
jgi:hypothetical protein